MTKILTSFWWVGTASCMRTFLKVYLIDLCHKSVWTIPSATTFNRRKIRWRYRSMSNQLMKILVVSQGMPKIWTKCLNSLVKDTILISRRSSNVWGRKKPLYLSEIRKIWALSNLCLVLKVLDQKWGVYQNKLSSQKNKKMLINSIKYFYVTFSNFRVQSKILYKNCLKMLILPTFLSSWISLLMTHLIKKLNMRLIGWLFIFSLKGMYQ